MNKVRVVDSLADSQKTAVFEYPVGFSDCVGRIGQMHIQCVAENRIKGLVWKRQFLDTADFKTFVGESLLSSRSASAFDLIFAEIHAGNVDGLVQFRKAKGYRAGAASTIEHVIPGFRYGMNVAHWVADLLPIMLEAEP